MDKHFSSLLVRVVRVWANLSPFSKCPHFPQSTLPLWALAADWVQKIHSEPGVPKPTEPEKDPSALLIGNAVRCQPRRKPNYCPLVILYSHKWHRERPARSCPCMWQGHLGVSGWKGPPESWTDYPQTPLQPYSTGWASRQQNCSLCALISAEAW